MLRVSYRFAGRFQNLDNYQVAVEGCAHGSLDIIYRAIAENDRISGHKTRLLLICGDFQALRNHSDFNTLAVPQKYKQLGDFYNYYSGKKTAPILTICIGGNHEASSYFWELYHGGWLAPNIYYLGRSGSVMVDGVRISGASCIYKPKDFIKGYFEKIPYNNYTLRSTYHIRQFDVSRLLHLPKPDIFLSHDWPLSIERYGDTNGLIRKKPFFKDEISKNELGSPPLLTLLQNLRPRQWFSAHLHVYFKAKWLSVSQSSSSGKRISSSPHAKQPSKRLKIVEDPTESNTNPDEIAIEDDVDDRPAEGANESKDRQKHDSNPEEIAIEDEEGDENGIEQVDDISSAPQPSDEEVTYFTALDKSLPNRKFLEAETDDRNASHRPFFTFDPYWLAITRAYHPFMSTQDSQTLPLEEEAKREIDVQLQWAKEYLSNVEVESVQQFVKTAPGDGDRGFTFKGQPHTYTNPQTEAFCQMLDIPNFVNPQPCEGMHHDL
ncbi:hypothetical protein E3P77_03456 [Wallemia ichthyophaga]|nr:hypothetical protein E3P77_03456 [Wallemia ichthyophaga]